MRNAHYFLLIFVVWLGCSPEDERFSFDSGLELVFSSDTVSFDTLLSTDTISRTERLRVFNPNQQAIQLNRISLGLGESSEYAVVINGKPSTSIFDEPLFGGDSLLILVSVDVSPRDTDLPYLVKDSIIFEWNGNTEHVKLVTYGQDGISLRNSTICNETWTGDRPYVISESLVVGEGCTLTIQPGTKIYFETDAALFVQGTLLALGDSSNHIEFRNARFDGIYDETPGQWDAIYFLEGSSGNQIQYTDIFNAQIGLRIGTPDDDNLPDVQVQSTSIFNMSFAGILAFTSDVTATNTQIYNCGTYLVGNFAGGNYEYVHCTFSNEPSLFIQDEPTVQFSDNIVLEDGSLLADELSIRLRNSIVWGTGEEELLINNGGGEVISSTISSCIIRSATSIDGNFASQQSNFPGFLNVFGFDYRLDSLAFARDKGEALGVEFDITGNPRDTSPDIGAFERIDRE